MFYHDWPESPVRCEESDETKFDLCTSFYKSSSSVSIHFESFPSWVSLLKKKKITLHLSSTEMDEGEKSDNGEK